jgi:glucose/mannose-6-phosphate isomerase
MSIARTAKIKFNENAKRPAFFNGLPEANHNEMIGFSNNAIGDFGILYLHDPASHPRIPERFNVMKKVFLREGLHNVAFREWVIPGETKIQRIFGAINFADWCSYTVALLDGVDPTPVALVESFKQVLAEG